MEIMGRVKTGLGKGLKDVFVAVLFMAVFVSGAKAAEVDPFQKIENVTRDLLVIIKNHKDGYPDNEVAYFAQLNQLLDAHVDFKYISTAVMGPYRNVASEAQRELFIQKFRGGLVETYGRGLIGYGDEEIVLVNRQALEDEERKVAVKQEIRGSGVIYPLEYHVARKKTGEWMVINVIINGINLRKVFTSQFVNAAQRADGDLDSVIASWASES
jgi:phospholipid transport system substrate-binding protein